MDWIILAHQEITHTSDSSGKVLLAVIIICALWGGFGGKGKGD